MDDERLWKKRFVAFALVRLFGLAVMMLGAAIALTDLVRPGGWPLAGGLLALAGAVDAIVSPRLMKKMWQRK